MSAGETFQGLPGWAKGVIAVVGTGIVVLVGWSVYEAVRKSSPSKPIKSILFIGDSNTAASFSYADQIRKTHPNLTIKKIAKIGAKTDWMLGQLKSELQNNNYDVVVILGGSNDIYATNSTDVAKFSLDSMYRLAKSKNSIVIAVTPPNKSFYIKKTDQKQALLYDLVDWIKKNKNVNEVIDFHKITNNKSFFNSNDGFLHAQAPAHAILANQTIQKLNI